MKARTTVCRWCGDEFKTKSGRAKDCPACRVANKKIRNRLEQRVRLGLLDKDMFASALQSSMRDAVSERKKREAASRPRCKFCGNVYGVDVTGFCAKCRADRFDDVYKTTGRSNGWDRKKTTKKEVNVEGGWRGRPVAGCSKKNGTPGIQEDWR